MEDEHHTPEPEEAEPRSECVGPADADGILQGEDSGGCAGGEEVADEVVDGDLVGRMLVSGADEVV